MIISLMPVAGRSAEEAAQRAAEFLRAHGVAAPNIADVRDLGEGRYQVDLEATIASLEIPADLRQR